MRIFAFAALSALLLTPLSPSLQAQTGREAQTPRERPSGPAEQKPGNADAESGRGTTGDETLEGRSAMSREKASRGGREGRPNQTENSGLTSKQVQGKQDPLPTPQGTKSPRDDSSGRTTAPPLQDSLAAVRAAPPDLQGRPIPRPNAWASEPGNPIEPTRAPDASDQTSREVK